MKEGNTSDEVLPYIVSFVTVQTPASKIEHGK